MRVEAPAHLGQLGAGELPVERPGGLVVAVHERQQGPASSSRLAKSLGVMTFFWVMEKKISA